MQSGNFSALSLYYGKHYLGRCRYCRLTSIIWGCEVAQPAIVHCRSKEIHMVRNLQEILPEMADASSVVACCLPIALVLKHQFIASQFACQQGASLSATSQIGLAFSSVKILFLNLTSCSTIKVKWHGANSSCSQKGVVVGCSGCWFDGGV